MPPRDYYRATRSSRSSGGAPPGEKGGGGYAAPSKTKSKVSKSVSTSDVATGKFTGGTQRPTPKPKPSPRDDKIPPKDRSDKGSAAASGAKVATAALGAKVAKKIVEKKPLQKWLYKGDTKGRKYYKDLSWKKGKELLKAESKLGGKWGYKWSHPANIAKSTFGKLKGLLTYPGTGGTPAERYLYEQGAKTFGKVGKFVGSRASLPITVGMASYGATNLLMNNTSVGQAIKDKAYNFGYYFGEGLHNINQKLKNFSLISSAQAGELDIYSPEAKDVTKQSRAGGEIPSIEEAAPSFDAGLMGTQEITPKETELLNEFNTFKDSGKVLDVSKKLAGALITGDIELEKQITDESSINFKIGNWGNNMSVMYNIQLGG